MVQENIIAGVEVVQKKRNCSRTSLFHLMDPSDETPGEHAASSLCIQRVFLLENEIG